MSVSIYAFVREKLVSHGAKKSPDGQITIANKRAFLHFVRLERAVRNSDFDAAQSALHATEAYLNLLGKRHLIVFAYLYLKFTAGGPKRTQEIKLEGGSILRSVEYRYAATSEQRIIAELGALYFERSGKAMLRIVYASRRQQR